MCPCVVAVARDPECWENHPIAGSVRRHEEAAARHERAAATHDGAAAFWEERGDRARADLHRDAAAHERAGAALERRWAELIGGEDDATGPPDQRSAAFTDQQDRTAGSEAYEIDVEIRESRVRMREDGSS